MPNIITLNCACYGGGAAIYAPVFQTGVQAQVDSLFFLFLSVCFNQSINQSIPHPLVINYVPKASLSISRAPGARPRMMTTILMSPNSFG